MSDQQAAEELCDVMAEVGRASYGMVSAIRGLNKFATLGGPIPEYDPKQWLQLIQSRKLRYNKFNQPLVSDWIDTFTIHDHSVKYWLKSVSELHERVYDAQPFVHNDKLPVAEQWTTRVRALIYRFVAIYPEWFRAGEQGRLILEG